MSRFTDLFKARDAGGLSVKPMGQLVTALGQYFTPPSDQIRGLDPNTWYSPLQPIKPFGPPGTEPRGFQYWSGQNLIFNPRPDAEYTAIQLKQLATYPLVRICIENVKDTITRASWQIQNRPAPGETRDQAKKRGKGDENILKISRFFEKPARNQMWDAWVRMLVEDMLVIDAGTILIRKSFNGEIVELPVLRGESITRYIDTNGWDPLPPDPAYAQNWWGMPLVNLTTDQLIYKPRNIVPRNTISSQLYGMSPVEQLAPEIEIGIERLRFVLAYYTEGSVPGVMQVVPKGTNPDKIAEAMAWMNSELAGNLAARRQIRLIQGWNEPGKSDQIVMTKEPLLSDSFDDQHTKRICFGIGVSPQRLSKQLNRATAQQQDEAAEIEGVLPYFTWLKVSIMDYLIQQVMGLIDYEWVPDPFEDPAFDKAAKAVNEMMNKPVMTINEARDRVGLEARPEPEADQLGLVTSTGWLPLDIAIEQSKAIAGMGPGGNASALGSKKTSPDSSTGDKPAGGKPNGKPADKVVDAVGRVEKAPPVRHDIKNSTVFGFSAGSSVTLVGGPGAEGYRIVEQPKPLTYFKASALDTRRAVIHPGRSLPASVLSRHAMEKLLMHEFGVMRRKTTRVLMKHVTKLLAGKLAKNSNEDKIRKDLEKQLRDNWEKIGNESEQPLASAILAGVGEGVIQLDIVDEGTVNAVNTDAAAWARKRSAELVGMRRMKDGSLIDNPRADMAISDTTQEKLKDIIARVLEGQMDLMAVEQAISETGVFSDTRAATIARTEIARAQASGNLELWKKSGYVKQVAWQLSMDHDHDDECDALAAGSPYEIDEVPVFPAHPNCMCALVIHNVQAGEKA